MGDFVWQKMSQFAGFLGNLVFRVSSRFTAKPMEMQAQLLDTLLRKNENTEYGKKNGFSSIHSIEEYQQKVPLTTYDDFEPYVERMLQGEQGLLTYKKIKHYVETSGSAGRPKLLPLCGKAIWNFQLMGFCAPLGSTANYYKKLGRKMPPQRSFLMVEVVNRKLPGGAVASCMSALPFTVLKPIAHHFSTSPHEVLFPEKVEEMDMNYLKLRFALPQENVSALAAALVTYIENLFEYLEQNWELLVADIEKGTISESVRCPADVRKKLLKKCKPAPERAAFLRREFKKGFDSPIAPRIWPHLEWTSAMRNGSLALYAEKLKRYCGDLPFNNTGFVASESLMAMPLEMSALDAVLLPKSVFFEFLPVGAPDTTVPLTMDKLEVGKDYEVIITNLGGLYRYRMFDVVRVTGFYQKTPKVEFLYRSNLVLNITGEKTTQQMLDWALTQVAKETGMSIARFCVYGSLEEGDRPHYCILVETENGEVRCSLAALTESIDRQLCRSNLYIDVRRRENVLGMPVVHYLKPGTFDAYRSMLRKNGVNMNQVKPVSILNTEERRAFFFENIEAT